MNAKHLIAAGVLRGLLLSAVVPVQAGTITAASEAATARAWVAGCVRADCAARRSANAPLWNPAGAAAPASGVGFRAARPVGFRYDRALLAAEGVHIDSAAAAAARSARLR